MDVRIVREDKMVQVNGEALYFDFTIDNNIWAVQFHANHGHIEYNDANIPNEDISSISQFQHIVDAHGVENERLKAEQIEATRLQEEERIANGGSVSTPES
jgi:hypothetical protein